MIIRFQKLMTVGTIGYSWGMTYFLFFKNKNINYYKGIENLPL